MGEITALLERVESERLQLIETFSARDASYDRLFGGEGRRVRRDQPSPRYLELLTETVELIAAIQRGRRPAWVLREALSTSDFPLIFGDVLDRQLLGTYREWPASYRNYCRIATVPDFRTVKRFAVDGSEAVLGTVPQGDEYPEAALSETKYEYAVTKFGRAIAFTWESIINDDLGALTDIPMHYGRAARRTEERQATQLFVDASGPHASFYTAGNKNIINAANAGAPFTANNPALSVAALQQGMAVLAKQVDVDGEPIVIDMVELVVPPGLEITALNILNGLELRINAELAGGGTANTQLIAVNWMKGRLRLNVNPYLPLVAGTANGTTSWFLFANPSAGRPALEIGFLRGNNEPAIFIKEPNARRVGGGVVNPLDGDFDNDSVRYKVRHVLGGTRLDPKTTAASNGSGA